MAQRFPNRTAQAGVYYTGGTGYIDVDSSFTVPEAFVRFSAIAVEDGWHAGDVVDVFVQKATDPTVWAIWTCVWDPTNEYLLFNDEQNSSGTLSDTTAVNVTATITKNFANTYEVPNLLGGMWALQDTVEVAYGQTEIIFSIPSGHEAFQITVSGLAMATTGAAYIALQLSQDGGATWISTYYQSIFTELYSTSATTGYSSNQGNLKLTTKQSDLPGSVNGSVIVSALGSTSSQPIFDSTFVSVEQSGSYTGMVRRVLGGSLSGWYGQGTFNMARLFVSAGSFSTGIVKSWARN